MKNLKISLMYLGLSLFFTYTAQASALEKIILCDRDESQIYLNYFSAQIRISILDDKGRITATRGDLYLVEPTKESSIAQNFSFEKVSGFLISDHEDWTLNLEWHSSDLQPPFNFNINSKAKKFNAIFSTNDGSYYAVCKIVPST